MPAHGLSVRTLECTRATSVTCALSGVLGEFVRMGEIGFLEGTILEDQCNGRSARRQFPVVTPRRGRG